MLKTLKTLKETDRGAFDTLWIAFVCSIGLAAVLFGASPVSAMEKRNSPHLSCVGTMRPCLTVHHGVPGRIVKLRRETVRTVIWIPSPIGGLLFPIPYP